MALQILNEPGLATTLGQSLNTGLQNLANYKLQNLQQANMARGIQGLTQQNITPDQRNQFIGILSPQMQQEYLKSELRRPNEEAYARALMGEDIQPGQRFTERQATELAKQQRSESKEQYEKAKPFIKNIRENAPVAKNLLTALDRMQAALDSGNVEWGLIKSKFYHPSLLNEDTQNFITAGNELVTLESDLTKGRPTDFKTRLIQGKKPSLEYSPEVNQGLINVLRKKAQKQVNLEKAYDEVSTKYGAKTPANFEQLIKGQAKKINKMSPIKLPSISEYEDGDVIQDKNGAYHMVSNGQWIDIDESQL